MPHVHIRHWITGKIIHSVSVDSPRPLFPVNLAGCDLTNADLRGADLCGANLERAILMGASLFEADLRRARLRGADLRYTNLDRADLVEADLSEVEKTDAASFEPLWQNPLETLRRAFAQALYATVAENENRIIGYQISTGGGQRAHLARLAVHPAVQGQGAGRALLNDLFVFLTHIGISRLSVNTQSDNQASLNLYQRMGFARTGEQYPVYTFDIPA